MTATILSSLFRGYNSRSADDATAAVLKAELCGEGTPDTLAVALASPDFIILIAVEEGGFHTSTMTFAGEGLLR